MYKEADPVFIFLELHTLTLEKTDSCGSKKAKYHTYIYAAFQHEQSLYIHVLFLVCVLAH